MSISVRVVRQGGDTLVAACDTELLGTTLRFGKVDFQVRQEFYGGQTLSVEEALLEIRCGTTVNLLGGKIVERALKAGLVHPEAVLSISGIPHALIVRI